MSAVDLKAAIKNLDALPAMPKLIEQIRKQAEETEQIPSTLD